MKVYEVTISETIQMTDLLRANSQAEAEEIAKAKWDSEMYLLAARESVGMKFEAKEYVKTKNCEREVGGAR
ncbi:MAG: hypothetical protein KHY34_01245 [Lachnospiraceae bacterium]|jgi:hypothetical protein|nr:hypothetical protein [Lachnospiraceae bacterium]